MEIETAGVDVNAKNQYGVTALINASFKGHKEIVELLIVEEADLNARDNKGDTAPQMVAAGKEIKKGVDGIETMLPAKDFVAQLRQRDFVVNETLTYL